MLIFPKLGAAELAALEQRIAERAVVVDIRANCVKQRDALGEWFDVRPMFDPRERPQPEIDMASQALDYAHGRGLIAAHPTDAHLVRIARQP